MSKQILRDVMVRFNGLDISSICRAVNLQSEKTEDDVTGYGGGGYREVIPGLDETQIDLDLLLGVDATPVVTTPTLMTPFVPGSPAYWNGLLFGPWHATGETAVVDIAPHNAASGSSNPWTTVTARLMKWSPLSGAVGGPAAGSMTLKATGAVTVS